MFFPLDLSGCTVEFISTPSSVSSSTLSCHSSFPSSWIRTRSSRIITSTAFRPPGKIFPSFKTILDQKVDVQVGEILLQLSVRLQQRPVQRRGRPGEAVQDLQALVGQQEGRGLSPDQLRSYITRIVKIIPVILSLIKLGKYETEIENIQPFLVLKVLNDETVL